MTSDSEKVIGKVTKEIAKKLKLVLSKNIGFDVMCLITAVVSVKIFL